MNQASFNQHAENLQGLQQRFDAVVMLTWSNWKTEPRSNRYHYARRFAESLPVLFVQPDCLKDQHWFEATEIPNVTLLHIPAEYISPTARQSQVTRIASALKEKQILRPLLWIYNSDLIDAVHGIYSPLKVYHATEDYLDDEAVVFSDDFNARLRSVLDCADLVITVSEELADTYRCLGNVKGPLIPVTNGCDYASLAKRPGEDEPAREKVVLYQGGINYRLNFDLLIEVALRMPDWTFQFCGLARFNPNIPVDRECQQRWEELCSLPNVQFLGFLDPEQVRSLMHRASVGIIPFVNTNTLVNRSFPLKAFEYVACGLPVVTVPIAALEKWSELFCFAHDANEFVEGIRGAACTRDDAAARELREKHARASSYDSKFQQVCDAIMRTDKRPSSGRYNLVFLCNPSVASGLGTRQEIEAFEDCTGHEIVQLDPATLNAGQIQLNLFDGMVIDSSIDLRDDATVLRLAEQLSAYRGLKVAFVRNGHDNPKKVAERLEQLGIHVVYAQSVEWLERYRSCFPKLAYVEFVAWEMSARCRPRYLPFKPSKNSKRKYVLSCVRNDMESWYATLVHERMALQPTLEEACQVSRILAMVRLTAPPANAAEAKNIFRDSVGVLCTDEAFKVADPEGLIREMKDPLKVVWREQTNVGARAEPGAGAKVSGELSMLMLEAMLQGCVLVLFEGEYAGLKPDVHYISLKRDLSNFREVAALLQSKVTVEEYVSRAHAEIVEPMLAQFETNARELDKRLRSLVGKPSGRRPMWRLVGFASNDSTNADSWRPGRREVLMRAPFFPDGKESARGRLVSKCENLARRAWFALPYRVREYLKPAVKFPLTVCHRFNTGFSVVLRKGNSLLARLESAASPSAPR
ncbi:MAG: glycosyltransferase [Gemmataceae bacterium]